MDAPWFRSLAEENEVKQPVIIAYEEGEKEVHKRVSVGPDAPVQKLVEGACREIAGVEPQGYVLRASPGQRLEAEARIGELGLREGQVLVLSRTSPGPEVFAMAEPPPRGVEAPVRRGGKGRFAKGFALTAILAGALGLFCWNGTLGTAGRFRESLASVAGERHGVRSLQPAPVKAEEPAPAHPITASRPVSASRPEASPGKQSQENTTQAPAPPPFPSSDGYKPSAAAQSLYEQGWSAEREGRLKEAQEHYGRSWQADKKWRLPLVRLIDVSTRLDPEVARDAFQLLTRLGQGEKQNKKK
jgi:hypothetical protein